MRVNDQLCRSALRGAGVALGVVLAAALSTSTAWATGGTTPPTGIPSPSARARAATPTTPQLRIAVDNGRTSVAVGDKPTYTITLDNLGTTAITGLVVTQSVPTGLNLTSADSSGVATAGLVSWRVNLKASGKATIHTTMTVSKTPKDVLRLATVACASTAVKGPPIVCAAHSDLLPAGAAAEAGKARAKVVPGATARSTGPNWWYVAGGVGAIAGVVAALATLIARRRNGGIVKARHARGEA
jgi:uncharacterized repeat protein (TIGR01451 family)